MLTTLSVALARKQELTACQKMAGKAGCHRTKIGYVTKDMGKNLLACIHTPDGSGICWPGGKTGYNMSIQPQV